MESTRSRIIVAGVVALVLAFVALTLLLFVFPDVNAPERSNAIVVLGAHGPGSFDEGVELANEGYAPTIALSLPAYAYQCNRSIPVSPTERVVCFRADPATTQGEARSIAAMASAHHWHRIIVVMPTIQATRARLRIERCYSGQVLEVAAAPDGLWGWAYGIAYEWAALVKALVLQRSC
jgi:hypothetical protein